MSSLGAGIGSFAEGLAKGIDIRRRMDDSAASRDIQKSILGLRQNEDRRAEELHSRQVQALDNALDDWAKNAMLRTLNRQAAEAKARNEIGSQGDTEYERKARHEAVDKATAEYRRRMNAAIKPVNKDGKSIFVVDGVEFDNRVDAESAYRSKYGSETDLLRNSGFLDQARIGLVRSGNLEAVKQWDEFAATDDARKFERAYIRGREALMRGDKKGFQESIDSVLNNRFSYYLKPYKPKVDIINADGKVAGAKITYTDPQTGEKSAAILDSPEKLLEMFEMAANPVLAFARIKSEFDAATKTKSERAKKLSEAEIDILKKQQESQIRMDEEMYKRQAGLGEKALDPNDFSRAVEAIINIEGRHAFSVKDEKGNVIRPMTEEEAAEKVQRFTQTMRRQATQGVVPTTPPSAGRPLLWTTPQQKTPPTPVQSK